MGEAEALEIVVTEAEPGAATDLMFALVRDGFRVTRYAAPGEVYEEERSGDSVTRLPDLRHLSIALAPLLAALPKLLRVFRDWFAKGGRRSLRLEVGAATIEVSNPSAEDQTKLIEAWIRAVTTTNQPQQPRRKKQNSHR